MSKLRDYKNFVMQKLISALIWEIEMHEVHYVNRLDWSI